MLLAKPIAEICLVPFSQVKSRTFANAYKNRGIGLKAHANGRNIVGQQLPTLLDVTRYVRLHRTQQLLKVLAPKCWELLRPFARSVKYLGSSKYVRRTERAGGGERGSHCVTPRVFTRQACRHPGHVFLKSDIFFRRAVSRGGGERCID